MSTENESVTFHNEGTISRISLWASIVGYAILVFTFIGFAQQIYQLSSNWSQIVPNLPTRLFERIAFFTFLTSQIFFEPLKGVFYFLVLRGISQLLNLGLDLYYADVDIIEIEEGDK